MTRESCIEGRGRSDARIIFKVDNENEGSCGFLNNNGFTAEVSPHGTRLRCIVKDSDDNLLLTTDMETAGKVWFADGQLIFHEGTVTAPPDGSYVIAEYQPKSGTRLPIEVSVGKQLEQFRRKPQKVPPVHDSDQ